MRQGSKNSSWRITISLILGMMLACMIAWAQPAFAAATQGSCGDDAIWSYSNGTLTISGSGTTGYDDYVDDYGKEIQKVVIQEGITGIESGAFDGCTALTEVSLPDTLTTIQGWAFSDCTKLKEIVIPGSVTQMAAGVFDGCTALESAVMAEDNSEYQSPEGSNCIIRNTYSGKTLWVGGLKSVIPESCNKIGNSSFAGRGLTEIVIPEGITDIDDYAFARCKKLGRIVLPQSLTKISAYAFSECDRLTQIYYGGSEEDWANVEVSSAENEAIAEAKFTYNTDNFDGTQIVAESGSYQVTTEDGEKGNISWKFRNGLLKLSGSGGVYTIGSKTGETWDDKGLGDQIERIEIEEGITAIGESAFTSIDSLKEVTVHGYMTLIGKRAFDNCGNLEKVVLERKVVEIGESAFENGGYELTVNGVIETIGKGGFNGCSHLILNANVTEMVKSPSVFVGLRELTLGENVTAIPANLFRRCIMLEEVTIPDTVTSIRPGAFADNPALKRVVLGKGLDTVTSSVFYECSGLEEVTIPSSVKTIEEDAFVADGYDYLKDIYYDGSEADWDEISIDSTNSRRLSKEKVCFDGMTKAQVAEQKINAIGEVTLESEELIVAARAYYDDLTEAQKAEVSEEAKETLESAEKTLKALKGDQWAQDGVSFENGVLTISKDRTKNDDGKFPWDDSLNAVTKIVMEDGVTSVPEYAFYDAENLREVEMADSVTSIGQSAFEYCGKLRKVRFSEGLQDIGEDAFEYCWKLEEANLPEGLRTIGSYGFAHTGITSIALTENLQKFGYGAFYGCGMEDNGTLDGIYGILFRGTKEQWEAIEGHDTLSYEGYDVIVYYGYTSKMDVLSDKIKKLSALGDAAGDDEDWMPARMAYDRLTTAERKQLSADAKRMEEKTILARSKYDDFENGYLNSENEDFTTEASGEYHWDGIDLIDGTLTVHPGADLDWTNKQPPWEDDNDSSSKTWMIKHVVIEDGVTSIAAGAFEKCHNLADVYVADSVTSIGEGAFAGCTYLREISLPAGLKSVGVSAFDGDYFFKRIYYRGTDAGWKTVSIDNAGGGNQNLINGHLYSGCATRMDYITSQLKKYADKEPTTADQYEVQSLCAVIRMLPEEERASIPEELESRARDLINMEDEDFANAGSDPDAPDDPEEQAIPVTPVLELSRTSYVYDGKVHRPRESVMINNSEWGSEEYEMIWPSGCKDVGIYTVRVKMTKGYTGSATATFRILPKGTSLKKLKAAKKSMTVTWKKQAVQTDGYQIQYSLKKKFTGSKTVTVKKAAAVKTKIKKLKSKKNYYVRVRTFKKVGSSTLYSPWSAAKKVKIK
ncbi:MAG: leucine-rich repeat domain-containing protein [Firmicutes bacterium]|nr:leucine-rich repeat domain-containing protein [Bacillota bacterium]